MSIFQTDFSHGGNVAARPQEAKINLHRPMCFDHILCIKDAPSLCCWRHSRLQSMTLLLYTCSVYVSIERIISRQTEQNMIEDQVPMGHATGRIIDLRTPPATSSHWQASWTHIWQSLTFHKLEKLSDFWQHAVSPQHTNRSSVWTSKIWHFLIS